MILETKLTLEFIKGYLNNTLQRSLYIKEIWQIKKLMGVYSEDLLTNTLKRISYKDRNKNIAVLLYKYLSETKQVKESQQKVQNILERLIANKF